MTLDRLRTHLTIVLFGAATLLFTAQAQAQLPVLSGGTHVKLWLGPDQPKIKGTIFSQTADTLRVASNGAVRVVPTSMVGGVEIGGGRSHTGGAVRGAKIGALIVGGAGAVLFGASYAAYDGEKQQHSSDVVAFIAASALSGAFYGAIIGAVVGTEAWTPVYPARVAISVTRPNDHSTGLGLSFKF